MASFASRALLSKGLSPIPGAQRLASHVTRRTMAAGEYADTTTTTDRRKTDLNRGPLQSLLFLLPRRNQGEGGGGVVFGGLDRAVSSSKPQASACPAWRRLDTVNVIAPPVGLPRSAFFFFFWQTLTQHHVVFFLSILCRVCFQSPAPPPR